MKGRLLFLLLSAVVCAVPARADENDTVAIGKFEAYQDASAVENLKPAKNVILMIGDGMGIEEVTAARIATFGRGMGLAMDRMPVMGQSITLSLSDDLITDSGAGATAMASGVKTLNGRIGEDKDAKPVKTILEVAAGLGKSTGIVAVIRVTHATPAAFASHVKSRSNEWEIASQLSAAPLTVLLGGGYSYFLPASNPESYRDDDLDLLAAMRKRGTTVTTDAAEFKGLDLSRVKSLVGLFYPDSPPRASERKPSLPEMTEAALKVLSRNPKGFFLMIEGSQIDGGGHGNNLQSVVEEVLDFDRTVEMVRRFAEQDGNTLVVVTADHETGGLSLNDASDRSKTLTAGWTTKEHTANLVPIFALGPSAQAFAGLHQNQQIPQIAVQVWGVKNFTRFAYEK
jgi:alkaline phosphatase